MTTHKKSAPGKASLVDQDELSSATMKKYQQMRDRLHEFVRKELEVGENITSLINLEAMWNALMLEASLMEVLIVTGTDAPRISQEELYELYTKMYNEHFKQYLEFERQYKEGTLDGCTE